MCEALQRKNRVYLHTAFCDRSGFIEAKHIHAGERFRAVRVLYQCFVFGETNNTDGKNNTCQQNKSLRNHTDHGGNGTDNGFTERITQYEVLLSKEQETNRVWRIWVDTRRRVVSFHEEEGSQLLEFQSRETFLRCVDEYTQKQYRYQ